MDFASEVASLLVQVPRGRVATLAAVADALGEVAAARAIFSEVRDDESVPNRHRVVRGDGRPVARGAAHRLRAEGVALDRGLVQDLASAAFSDFRTGRPLARLREEQIRLRDAVRSRDGFRRVRTVAGFDLAYARDFAFAAGVVVSFPRGEVLGTAAVRERVAFPYIPGYLAYREAPAILTCYELLEPRPDIVLVDGHGVLHPARFGLASLVGVRLRVATIGCAKSLLVGRVERMPRPRQSSRIFVDGEVLGRALRGGASRHLTFISVGHRVRLATAVRIVSRLCRTWIPEPLREAHALATSMRKGMRKRDEEKG